MKSLPPESSPEELTRSRRTWMLRVLPGFLLSFAGTQIVLNPSEILLAATGIHRFDAPVRSLIAFGLLLDVVAGLVLTVGAALLRFRIGTLRFVFYSFTIPGLLGPFGLAFAVFCWELSRILRRFLY